MKQHDLQPAVGSTHSKKRVGRGYGSGSVKTSGRGQKGQKARTGHSKVPVWFEGSPSKTNSIKRQGYKRGVSFNNPNHVDYEVINLTRLAELDGDTFTPEVLTGLGIIPSTNSAVLPQKIVTLLGGPEKAGSTTRLVKILGVGEINRAITVHAHRFSASARQKIEAAGGSVVELMAYPEGKGPQAQSAEQAQ
ncbi:MAG: 50S ribosomal protein L15 [Chloroflexi bacterium]|nr:50S ribosomal protein L15 [Chloroflexota bacterium]OJW06018.1 MAG: 50S ribosomal protein L15 [Chloroflexi bacterium 54-19]